MEPAGVRDGHHVLTLITRWAFVMVNEFPSDFPR